MRACLPRLLVCLLAGGTAAFAQEPVATAPEAPPSEEPAFLPGPAYGEAAPARDGIAAVLPGPLASLAPPEPGGRSPYAWGPVALWPSFGYQYLDTTGLLASPGQPTDSSMQSFSPGLLFTLGKVWTFDYTPTWTFYSNPLFRDSVDQEAKLQGSTAYESWTFDLAQDYDRTSQVLVETGGETPEEDYDTILGATFDANDRTRLELGLTQDITTSAVVPGSREWSTADSLHYALTPRWDLSVGPSLGYVTVNPGFAMVYVRLEARVAWQASERVKFNLMGGEESRKIDGSGTHDLTTGIFSGSAEFQLREGTILSASANRDVEVAYSVDDVTANTQASLNLQQRLLRRFYLNLSGGYETVDYISLVPESAPSRADRLTTLEASLSTTLFRRISLTIECSRARNASNSAGYVFTSDQVGLIAAYRY